MQFRGIFVWIVEAYMACRVRVNKSIRLKFWWLSHRDVGSNPGHDTCVFEQDT